MRTFALLAVVFSALIATTAPSAATTPTLRIGTAATLSLVGNGFKPRVLVTLRVVSPEVTRSVKVRTSARGTFAYRFVGVERCAPDLVTARMPNGTGARVPPLWFVRECPPPPPLQPGISPT